MNNYIVSPPSSTRRSGATAIGALKARSTAHCVLKAIRQLAPQSEPWRVRLAVQDMRGKVITDGAFFTVIQSLRANDHIRMVRREPNASRGPTGRGAGRSPGIGIYEMTERGRRSLTTTDNEGALHRWRWPAMSLDLLPGKWPRRLEG